MYDQLLTIKLYAPPLRPGMIHRQLLLQKLNRGIEQGCQLTLVSAPAGYGKTTLVREWLEQCNRPYGWLSLERTENHPALFLSYMVAAFQQVDPSIGHELQASLKPAVWSNITDGQLPILLAPLVNEISRHPQPFFLVLDDYHVINELSVHSAVEFLLSHQPPNMHLVVITRQDPLLPLSGLRARGRLAEIRLGDLRFCEEEAGLFLNDTLGLGLSTEEVSILATRTEGWIAGLQLAGISLAEAIASLPGAPEKDTCTRLIQNFAGDDRYIMDYLMDEVLSREPENVQDFLLSTSLLKRLCGPLCDAVLESNWTPGTSQAIIDRLEKTNLFLIPLDNRRHWYRYHHLFADLLTSRLQAISPGQVSRIHARASAWYEKENSIPEAVDHALLAEDFERALKLIERTAEKSIWATGDLPILLNWSRRLPEDLLVTRPSLSLYYARGLFFSGQIQAAGIYLDQSEQALLRRGKDDPQASELWGVLWLNRATIAAMRGETQIALALATQANQRLVDADDSTRGRICHAIGIAEFLSGHVQRAEMEFERGFHLACASANRNLGMDLAGCRAQALISGGKLNLASQACADGLAAFLGGASAPAATAIYLAMALIAYERNDLAAAQECLFTCLELGKQAGWPHILWQAYALLAQVNQAQGDPAASAQAIEQADQLAASYSIPWVTRILAAIRARLGLERGNLHAAEDWAEQYRQQVYGEYVQECEDLTLARLYLAQVKPGAALEILNHRLEQARDDGRLRSVMEILILRALVFSARDETALAQASMREALTLASHEGFLRVFVQEGTALVPIFQVFISTSNHPFSRSEEELTRQILASVSGDRSAEGSQAHRLPVPSKGEEQGLLEPLSERELEVLRLIAEGLTNPEIASRLYLSVNTLRAHTTHIYRKLDVHNRIQAVERARSLGLLISF